MNLTFRDYRIRARKRGDGRLIEGVTRWDGLASLFCVTPDGGGADCYVSVLDSIELLEPVEDAR